MNKIFMSLIVLISASALAAPPKVGDTAIYEVYASESMFGNVYREERSLTKYNSSDLTFGFQVVITLDDGTAYNTYADVPEDVILGLYVLNKLEYCTSMGDYGAMEEVSTPLGTFMSCKVDQGSYVKWMSDQVPFGLIKSVRYDSKGTIKEEFSLVEIKN